MLESSDLPEGQQEILTVVLTGVVINGGFVNKVPVHLREPSVRFARSHLPLGGFSRVATAL